MSNNQTSLNELVSKHLGRAGDGSVVNPYVTPDSIEKDLLVAVPRSLNRTDYGIDDENLPFIGFDTWNCYEVSALMENGYPVSGQVKLVYASDSKCIVESKSLKLYLNSYNMAKMGATYEEACANIEIQITRDLSEVLQTNVRVAFFDYSVQDQKWDAVSPDFDIIEDFVDVNTMTFDQYNEDPNTLVIVDQERMYDAWTTNALRSNCRVTNQPDWGNIYVYIEGTKTVTPESLLQYIVSMRKENHFHEEIVECVYKRLYDLLPQGTIIGVCALYTRRGGIDINPCRVSNQDLIDDLFNDLAEALEPHKKTARQ